APVMMTAIPRCRHDWGGRDYRDDHGGRRLDRGGRGLEIIRIVSRVRLLDVPQQEPSQDQGREPECSLVFDHNFLCSFSFRERTDIPSSCKKDIGLHPSYTDNGSSCKSRFSRSHWPGNPAKTHKFHLPQTPMTHMATIFSFCRHWFWGLEWEK